MISDEKMVSNLIALFEKSGLTELEFSNKQISLKLKRSSVKSEKTEEIVSREIKKGKDEKVTIITSPLVGTFYRAPAPDAPPFVEKGTKVSKGDVICIIEAMKMMNSIEAEFDCMIREILQENGEKVEFGTPLFEVVRD